MTREEQGEWRKATFVAMLAIGLPATVALQEAVGFDRIPSILIGGFSGGLLGPFVGVIWVRARRG